MNKHYYFALVTEIVGICVIGAGLCEKIMFEVDNPTGILITAGSMILSIGSLYFAKYIKWKNKDKE